MKIKFYTKSVYGTQHKYPACEISRALCKALGLRTITFQVEQILRLFDVEQERIFAPE